MSSESPRSPDAWSKLLKDDWERRAQSPSRDFFVASHPGWNKPERWAAQAQADTDGILLGVDRQELTRAHMLEIGCGVGRLARTFRPLVQSYTGFDISASMVSEASERNADLPDTRFFEGDGLRVPDGARDRAYDFVLSLAVFIHCPKDVISGLLEDAWSLMSPGALLRCQVRANAKDPTGIDTGSVQAAETMEKTSKKVMEEATDDQMDLIDDHPYMGYEFGYDEFAALVAERSPAETKIFRPDATMIYASLRKA